MLLYHPTCHDALLVKFAFGFGCSEAALTDLTKKLYCEVTIILYSDAGWGFH